MTQEDKKEMFRSNMRIAVLNAHKYGLSWRSLHEIIANQNREIWARHQEMLTLFPENRKHHPNDRL